MALFSTCYLWVSAIYFLAFVEVHYAIECLSDFCGGRENQIGLFIVLVSSI